MDCFISRRTAAYLDTLVSVAVSNIYWRRASIALVWTMDGHVIADHMAGCIIACKFNGYGMPFQVVLSSKKMKGITTSPYQGNPSR